MNDFINENYVLSVFLLSCGMHITCEDVAWAFGATRQLRKIFRCYKRNEPRNRAIEDIGKNKSQ